MGDAGEIRIGIDLGGTKIAGVALGPDGTALAECRLPTPREDYAATISAIGDLIDILEREVSARGSIGIGIPGSISPVSGRIQNANSTWLNGQRMDADLEGHLARPVRLANDANCFALSEAVDGAGAEFRSIFGVILGTGCGGAFVHDGKLLTGPLGCGGEWGHMPLPWAHADEHPGPACWCGQRGCLETWISGTGLAEDHFRVTGHRRTGEDIAASASSGDAEAQASLDRHAHRTARGLAAVVNLLDPEAIVLGGGLSRLPHLYEALPRLIPDFVFADKPSAVVLPPQHGDASGVRGAAWLWGQDE